MKSLLAPLAFALVLGCAPVKRPDGGVGMLPIKSMAPEVEARTAANEEVKLTEMRGKPVVLYFYPADGTPGCTTEACAFRDSWKKYETANVGIIGISTDSAESHKKFQAAHKLPFPLAADPEGKLGIAYGVPKGPLGYERVSFLIDRGGRVARIWQSVDPGVHADEVLNEAKKLGN